MSPFVRATSGRRAWTRLRAAAARVAALPRRAGDVVSRPRDRSLGPVLTLLDEARHELRPVAARMRERVPAALGGLGVEGHVAGSPVLARRLRPHDGGAAVSAGGVE